MRSIWLARKLFARLRQYAADNEPTQIITNGTEKMTPYLRRWKIVNAQWNHPGVYLHNMILNDDAALHDHPYASVSIVLSGVIEEVSKQTPTSGITTLRVYEEGDIVYRSSVFSHQLRLPEGEAWTLFVPFRRLEKKGWGFYCPENGYVPFQKYFKQRREGIAAGRTGPLIGCGEGEAE